MAVSVELELMVLVSTIVLFGGVVKGTAGFGYAISSTALLATVIDPAQAIVVVILPMLAANVSIVRELGRDGLKRCLTRFWPYLLPALVGTLAGMAVLNRVPQALLALGLGVLTAGYVLTVQPYVRIPGEAWVRRQCFREETVVTAALGLVSGVVFGASNVAVHVVAFLDSLELDRSTFAGVLAMILVGVATVRVAAAWSLGLYAGGALSLSVVAVVPGLAGVVIGRRIRRRVPAHHIRLAAVVLLAVIAVRLTAAGVQGL